MLGKEYDQSKYGERCNARAESEEDERQVDISILDEQYGKKTATEAAQRCTCGNTTRWKRVVCGRDLPAGTLLTVCTEYHPLLDKFGTLPRPPGKECEQVLWTGVIHKAASTGWQVPAENMLRAEGHSAGNNT